jgi:sterol-4alpha-carboxylate 3-dehydrogenase (decarboxylating)
LWDVTYVGNIAVAHVLAIENMLSSKTAAGEAFFISNESPITFRDFCLAVWREFDHYPPFEVQLPEALAASVGYVAEWITWLTGTQTTISSASVKDACSVRYCTGQKARKILGYKPRVGLEEGIRISCAEYAERLKARAEEPKPSSARFGALPIQSNTLKAPRA